MDIRVKVNSTYNNTILTALYKDRILKTISTGSIGFKKAKRASALAAQAAGESLGYWLLLLEKSQSNFKLSNETNNNKQTSIINSKLLEKLKIPNQKLVTYSIPKNNASSEGNTNLKNKNSKNTNSNIKGKKVNIQKVMNSNTIKSEGNNLSKNTLSDLDTTKNKLLDVSVMVSGVGQGKFGAIKGLSKMGLNIKKLSEITAIPHNGCKPPKMRRK